MSIITTLTPRWTEFRYNEKQEKYWMSNARFNVVPAGRRSGKTEIAKRRLVFRAIHCRDHTVPGLLLPPNVIPSMFENPQYFCGAPTWRQACDLYWNDLKALVPNWALARQDSRNKAILEGDKIIKLYNGARICVFGMDKPERIEGQPWDGGVLDEYGNMKARTWPENVRPALADRKGWCDFIGVPEGRNHYYDLNEYAKKVQAEAEINDYDPMWVAHKWTSEEILDEQEILDLRESLDELTYRQEILADFIYFQGRVYYPFDYRIHCRRLQYNPKAPLIFCFDFNISPGVAAVCQEQPLPGVVETIYNEQLNQEFERPIVGTGVINEVYIPTNSNTVAVCNKLIADWERHEGEVHIYGDMTGGTGGSAKLAGSDWDIVRKMFRNKWEGRIFYFIPTDNPSQRGRINAVNSRLMSTSGVVRMMVDPDKASHVVKDLEGVRLLEGGSGDIDKKADPKLSHISDALGYYIAYRFPVQELRGASFELLW